jgi:hypothetical protein
MDTFLTVEWDRDCGILSLNMLNFLQKIQSHFSMQSYGSSIKGLTVLAIWRAYDFKQRKRFKKDAAYFYYDILLDFYLIKNVNIEDKKKLIKYQLVKITEETFSKYKFVDFDKAAFLADFRNIVDSTPW